MTALPFSRLTIIGFLLFAPGLYYTLRFTSGFFRMVYRKFRKGRPYLQGSALDYFWFAVASFAATMVGAVLLAASLLQGGLQPYEGTREVGIVQALAPEKGRIRLTLDLGMTHPVRQQMEADLPGARWALEGEFLRWRSVPRWLGFTDGHRVEAALGSDTDSGAPDRPEKARALIAGAYAPWYLARRHPRWVPVAQTTVRRTPRLPAEGHTFKIIVTDVRYVMVEKVQEANEASFDTAGDSGSGGR